MSEFVKSDKSGNEYMYDIHDSHRGELYGAAYLCLGESYSKVIDFSIFENVIRIHGEEYDQHTLETILECVELTESAYPDCTLKFSSSRIKKEHTYLLRKKRIQRLPVITNQIVFA